jgi:DNA-binding NarL/FixJ family response regulator
MRYVLKRFAEAFEIIIRPEKYVPLSDEMTVALQDLQKQGQENNFGQDGQYQGRLNGLRTVAQDVLRFGLRYKWTAVEHMRIWEQLTPREQEVTAYVCLGYTNYMIARRLVISTSTVKSHIRNVLMKFGLNGKLELKTVLDDWDFSQWDDAWELGFD